jgi:serine/threonine protein kinase
VTDDKYVIEQQIDRGHFGVVYLAHHPVLKSRKVALKLIPMRGDRAELFGEATKLAQLPEHANVVKVHDAGEWDPDHLFIASELCKRGSLARLDGGAPLDPAQACRLVSQACRGLEHLHQHELLHLDIRPANILLSDAGEAMLVDFGLARWTHDAEVETWYGPHAAPELVESGEASAKTDIFAMGMTLSHLLTGGAICRPFPLQSALVEASSNGEWPRLGELGVNVPRRLKAVITQATEYDPEKRPQDVGEFKRALDRATPAISLLSNPEGVLVSVDGDWTVEVVKRRDGSDVVVKRNGRRRNDLGAKELGNAVAKKHMQKLVNKFADDVP